MSQDAELLRRYAESRSEEAFAELVRRHLNLVYFAALRRTGDNTHLSEEIAQDVFTALARDAASLTKHATLAGWLYTTTRFTAAKAVRTDRRRQAREQEAYLMRELSTGAETETDWEKLRPVLDAALDELNERDREAVLLRCLEGQAFGEIGETLRLTEDAARMRVDRALGKLHALLVRRGITSTSAALGAALVSQTAAAAPAGLAATVTGAALAGGGAAVAAGWIGFMSTNKLAVGISALLLLLATGTMVREVDARHAAETSVAEVRRDTGALVARRRAVDDRVRAAGQEVVRLAQAIDEARREVEPATQAPTAVTTWDPEVEGRAFMARHPEFKQAFMDYHRAELNLRYGAFFKSRGLTPEQIETFGTLMLADSSQSEQLGTEMKAYTFSFADAASRSEMLASLGEDGRGKFEEFTQEYFRDDVARWAATELATSLIFTDTPLAPAQAEQLMRMVEESRSKPPGGRETKIEWSAVFAKADGILQAPQLAVLRGIQARERAGRAVNSETAVETPVSPAASPTEVQLK